MNIEPNNIYLGDCLELMTNIPDKSIDMILCDLPYGTTACSWDTIIPFEPLWNQYHRIIKDNGAIVLTSSQPFTSYLIMSNIKNYRYELIWEKGQGTNPMMAKKQIMKIHENISIFYKKQCTYNPQMGIGKPYKGFVSEDKTIGEVYGSLKSKHSENKGTRYPTSILKHNREFGLHPTQKPVALLEYLIKTFSNPDDVILDNCIGSGSTIIACINTGRRYIGIEKDDVYFNIALDRISKINLVD